MQGESELYEADSEEFDSWTYPSEDEENESLALHYKNCRKAENDEYCKICLEY